MEVGLWRVAETGHFPGVLWSPISGVGVRISYLS